MWEYRKTFSGEFQRTLLGIAGLRSCNVSPDARRSSPTRVLNASLSVKIAVAFGVLVSSYAVYAFLDLHLPNLPISLALKLGLLCAGICAVTAFYFCWCSVVAYVVRKCNLSPNACAWAGLPLTLVGFALFMPYLFGWHGNENGSILFLLGMPCSVFCRKLAYPAVPE